MGKSIKADTSATIRLCDNIVDQIETRREIEGWLAQARREAEMELRIRTQFRAR